MLAALASDEGGRTVREIRALLQVLQNNELGELAEHSGTMARRAESFQNLGVGLLELAVALAGADAWLLLRRVRHLEQFITVCAWTRRVRWQNRWISFEDYLAQRFQVHCTHGICEEAAQRMKKEILAETPPAELRRRQPPGFTATASDT